MPRRPPGRPALPAERRRVCRLTLRLNPTEVVALRRLAAQACLPAAAYARRAALRRGAPPRAVPVAAIRIVGQLGRLANNLNQLTKLAHQGRTSPGLLPCLEAVRKEVQALRRQMIGLPAREG